MSDEVENRQANQLFVQGTNIQQSSNNQDPFRIDVQSELGFEIPVDLVPLPSRGICYDAGSVLANCSEVKVKAMTSREEDILTSAAFVKNGTVLTQLFKSCILEPRGIDPRMLLAGDRAALMVALRITGYGSDYTVDSECPDCNHVQPTKFELNELPVKFLEAEPDSPHTNSFTTILPVSKVKVTFKLLTGADEEEAVATSMAKRKKLKMQLDDKVTNRWRRQIIAVNGRSDGTTISNFVQRMPVRDSRYLMKYIRDIEPGMTMRAPMKCENCGVESEVAVELGPKFFWPDD